MGIKRRKLLPKKLRDLRIKGTNKYTKVQLIGFIIFLKELIKFNEWHTTEIFILTLINNKSEKNSLKMQFYAFWGVKKNYQKVEGTGGT